jgi:competence protein ComEC
MDEVRRKLELIDRQLAGRNLHDQIISTCPLVFVATGFIVGILMQGELPLPVPMWFVLLGLLAATAVFSFFIRRLSSVSRYVTGYLALSCFVCLGAIRLTQYGQPEANDIRHLVPEERRLATIRGRIVTELYINRYPAWTFARFKPTDPASSFYLKVNEVETVAGWAKVTGAVRVQVDEPVMDLRAGDAIQAYCWLERFGPPTNPGQFDMAAYLARRNILVAASVTSRDAITLLQGPAVGVLARLKTYITRAATQALLGDLPQEQEGAAGRGLLEALLLGYRRDIDSATYEAFRKTGLLHIVSLSGMHFAILIGSIWWFCKVAGLLKKARAAVCLAVIALFLIVVPPAAPTVRAAIMSAVFCASYFFRRRPSAYNALALSAIILLLIRPTQLVEADWQLSFSALLGILLFTGRLENLLHQATVNWFGTDPAGHGAIVVRALKYLGRQFARAFCAGLAAWLGSAGVLLYHFYTITPLASLWTVLVSPLVSAILTLGFLKILLSFLLPSLSAVLGIVVANLADWLIGLAKLFAHVEISQILIGRISVVPVILYYLAIVFVAFVSIRRAFLKPAIAIVMISVLVCSLGAGVLQKKYRGNLVLTCLDVGHGQAIVAQLPGKTNVLFDAGSLHRSDIGTRIVAPFLDYAGIAKIDAVIISHNDTDHINGIPEIVEHCKVGSVYANDAFFDGGDVWGTAKHLSDYLGEKGLEIRHLPEALRVKSSASMKVLWPNKQSDESQNVTDNDRSLVSLIEFAGAKILLCSDIEEFAQTELLALYPGLRADVVVVPHHGSAKTLGANFLAHLDTSVVICSCDQAQYERMIGDSASTPFSPNRAKSFYTARNGAVRVCVSRDGTIQTRVCAKSDPPILSAQGS